MALGGQATSVGLRGDEIDDFSLTDVVRVFNSPINEEQAWAVCYQCTQCFIRGVSEQEYADFCRDGGRALRICRDGTVAVESSGSGKAHPDRSTTNDGDKKNSSTCRSYQKALETLGLTIFQALDYGLKEHEERHLSQSVESLIELMTVSNEDSKGDNHESHSVDDEGIENDVEDEDDQCHMTERLDRKQQLIMKMCQDRLSSPQNAGQHYKAVCRALVAEVVELLSFLDKISGDEKALKAVCSAEELTIDELERGDWARLWVQIMRELRHGVKLKKVEHVHLPPVEYELTPYEVLMEDIRSRRYTLNKIMVNGDIPRKVKNDAHEVILNFIRSRPPLQPVKDRVLSAAPPKKLNEREKLMDAIRGQPKLKPLKSPEAKSHVENSRTRIFDSDSDDEGDVPVRVRQVIKPDISLLLNSSTELEEEDELDAVNETTTDDDEDQARTRIIPTPLSPLTSLSPPTTPKPVSSVTWRETAVDDLIANRSEKKLARRHSITVCESPGKVPANGGFSWPWSRFRRSPQDSIPEHEDATEKGSESRTPVNGACSLSPGSVPDRTPTNNLSHSRLSCCSDHAHDKTANNLSQLNASELMHVSWKTECPRKSHSQSTAPCEDCRPVPGYIDLYRTYTKKWQNPVECLSLRLDEVMHIREVLTKAELESLSNQPFLYNQISKVKLCFTCKTTRFTLFGQWGTKCRLCKRTVCNKCLRKMNVPTDRFEKIPVYTLSPTPLTPEGQDLLTKFVGTGSKPPSPVITSQPVIKPVVTSSGKRRPLMRSHTITSRPPEAEAFIKGPQMNVCCECKKMVCEIIRVSRTSVTLATHGNDWQPQKSRASRNFHLDLKPV
ncbi:protein spire homolog 1-like [Liolophura sinensis]|uniref:protein spire homolog 1-like n=1 Tax=Liolophura sinensis TaxID=3198878 RepID=UPI0031592A5C